MTVFLTDFSRSSFSANRVWRVSASDFETNFVRREVSVRAVSMNAAGSYCSEIFARTS